jgi:ABC-2 type transport system permease protein
VRRRLRGAALEGEVNFARVLTVLKKDVRRAPRSGIVALAVLYPVLITVIVQLIFGSIFDPSPRIGVIDLGSSELVAEMVAGPVEVTRFESADEAKMWREVELGNLDLGMIVPANYDEGLRAGKPVAATQKISTQANLQALVKLEGLVLASVIDKLPVQPVAIEQVKLTDKVAKSWTERLLPLIVLLSFFVAGTFLTGFAIVDEKLRGTLRAVLTTPTKVSEVVLAKSIFSFGIAFMASGLALWLNGALSAISPTLALAFGLAAVMTIELGIIVGFASKDVNSLYGIVKGMGPLVMLTVLPYLWDGWPAWISKAIPLWYVIHPIVEIVNEGKVFGEIGVDFGIAGALCVVMLFAAMFIANKRAEQLDALA